MLVEFSVANHRAIRERQTLSMVPDSDSADRRKAPERAIETGHPAIPHLLPDACILGANGTGKTSLLSAMDVMASVIAVSAEHKSDSKIEVEPFARKRGWDRRPSAFEATFLSGAAAYRYGFEATCNRVTSESLAVHTAKAKDWSVLFERTWIPKTKKHEVAYAAKPKGGRPAWLSKTRPNALLLSAAAKASAGGHLERAHAWLTGQLGTSRESTPARNARPNRLRLRKAQWRKRIVEFFRDLGVRLDGLEIEEFHAADMFTFDDVPSPFREILMRSGTTLDSLREAHRQKQPDNVLFDVSLLHDGGSAPVPIKSESSGIQTVYAFAEPVLHALETGRMIVADDLSAELDPAAVEALIGMFCEPAANPKGAQIIFTTRDPANGREAFFERDQVWIMEMEHGEHAASLRCEQNFEGRRGVRNLLEDHLGGGGRSIL